MLVKTHRLKLKSLKFISSVDVPAQQTAVARLLKRGTDIQVTTTARAVKLSDELGLVFGWALTTKANGADYFDLQGDNIVEDDLIKVAAAFMEAGGAGDTMHDRQRDGRVVFAMPLTAEVAKAFGIETDTHGLMIAMKPSPEDFAKFKTGELCGFSIDGMGERTPVDKAAPTTKHALYTTTVDGHAHTVDVACGMEPGYSWYTSYQNSEGAESGHSHAVVRNADGTIEILADSGHTHEIAPDQAAVVVVPADAVVVVQNRVKNPADALLDIAANSVDKSILGILERNKPAIAAMLKSTQPASAPTVVTPSKESKMTITDHEKQIADLTKRNERLELIAKLSGAQKAHFDTLIGDAAADFLAKSTADRDLVIADIAKRHDEADKVVYLSKTSNEVYKAKDDPRLVEMAKRLDAESEKVEKADIRKQATELLGGMPGDDATHDLIVGALRKSGAKAEDLEKAFATLKGMRATSRLGKGAAGAVDNEGDNADSSTAMDNLRKGLTTFCKAQNITKNLWVDGLKAFVQTTEGAALKRAVDESAS